MQKDGFAGRVFFLAALIVTASMAVIYAFTAPIVRTRHELALRQARLRGQVVRLWERSLDLERQERLLRTDPATIARVARRSLGWRRPGELLQPQIAPPPLPAPPIKVIKPLPEKRLAPSRTRSPRAVARVGAVEALRRALLPSLALLAVGAAALVLFKRARPDFTFHLRSTAITPRT